MALRWHRQALDDLRGIHDYIAAYRKRGADVEILLVVHTSRLWPDQLPASR